MQHEFEECVFAFAMTRPSPRHSRSHQGPVWGRIGLVGITAVFYEVYRDDAAFDVHRNELSFAHSGEKRLPEMVVRIAGTRCAVLD